MIGGKKIISTLFPKVRELPKEIVEHYAKKANDGMIIFSPSKNVEREKSHFFCLKCGTHGETTEDTPTCPNCGNSNSRAPITSRRYSDECQIVRYIQQVDEYAVISEYDCYAQESAKEGIIPKSRELFRIVLSDTEFRVFVYSQKYERSTTIDVWCERKEVFDHRKKNTKLVIAEPCVYANRFMMKLADDLSLPSADLFEKLKLVAVGAAEQQVAMPKVSFEPFDESKFTGVLSRWHVEIQKHPVEKSENFVKILSWCSNCGKFHRRIENVQYGTSRSGCPTCGERSTYYQRDINHVFHYVDAAETEDGEIVIRVQGMLFDKVIVEEVREDLDPIVENRLVNLFTNYIYVDCNGEIFFFDENKEGIDKLQIQINNNRNTLHKEYIFSEKGKELIRNNKWVKRTGYDILVNTNTSPRYFEYLKTIPSMEIFAKSEMFMLIADIMKKKVEDLPAFIRGTSKQKSLKNLSKPQLDSLRSQFVSLKHLDAYLQCLGKDPDALFEDFLRLSTLAHERHILDILRVGVPGMTVKKIAEYIDRVDDVQCCPPSTSMQLWADYLRMLRDSGCDLTDSTLIFTHSLKREHDKVTRKLEQIKDEKLVADFEQKAIDNDWLEYKGKKLSAVIPHSLEELYEEGRKLSHCVGSYAKSIVDGSSVIVFLRKNVKPDVPYCTVELRENKIVQVRGWDNCEGISFPDIRGFLKIWAEQKGLNLDVA